MSGTKKYIIAIDQSTSASKVMLFNKKAELVQRISLSHHQYYPRPGFVEHNPMEIFNNTLKGIKKVMKASNADVSEIASIAITNQRETSLIWNKKTGKPIGNAAVWQCQRGLSLCNKLKEKGLNKMVQEKTGMLIDPYFSASKLHWMMNNLNGLKDNAEDLLCGTMDSWLLYKLSGGKVHATDYSNACRTLLFNIHTLKWDNELTALFEVNKSMLPEVKYSDEIFGYTDPSVIFNKAVPISGLLGDSHAALFGQNCFTPGLGKATYGTGSSVMMNVGNKPLSPPEGLVTSIGFGYNKKIDYVFEGNIHCTGDTINWLINELQLINIASESEKLANTLESNCGVYLVPAFVGLGAPYWDNEARACLIGMSRDTTRAHIARAALESIAYQVKDLVERMSQNTVVKLKELRVDGGPTKNNFLMQFQADMLQGKVNRSEIEEISALGATFMAGLATGFWNNLEEIKQLRNPGNSFRVHMDNKDMEMLYEGWKQAIRKSRLK